MQLVEVVVQVRPPGVEVAVYPVIVEPPELAGAAHETTAEPSPAVALTLVGAPGTVLGILEIEFDAVDAPTELTALTVTG